MGRPEKTKLDFFPVDCDFFSDRKIKRFAREYKAEAIGLYVTALIRIYSDQGYYTVADEDFFIDIANDVNVPEEHVKEVLEYAVSLGLFDAELYKNEGVFTSKGIQSRYQNIINKGKKGGFFLSGKHVLIPEKPELIPDKLGLIPEKPDYSSKNDINKIKENKNKENKTKEKKKLLLSESIEILDKTDSFSGKVRESLASWLRYKDEINDRYVTAGLLALFSQVRKAIEEYGEDEFIDVVERSIASGYRGIGWYWFGEKGQKRISNKAEEARRFKI